MGTPGFACKPLEVLHRSRHEVIAAVTGQAKRRGRRGDECPTDVCCTAYELELPVYTPKTLKSRKLREQLTELKPDLFVVVAFRILPEALHTLPKYGSINIHGSLLPKYRGAAPINWALINGERETGLTSFFLNPQVDTGNVILQESTSIDDNDNFDSLYTRLSEMSGAFLLRTLDLIEQPGFKAQAQDETLASPAPKLSPFDAMIDFGFPARNVHNFIRGLSTVPGACTNFRGKKVKVLAAQVADVATEQDLRPGTIIADRQRLLVQCSNSVIELLQVVPEGRKVMDGRSFANGLQPRDGEVMGEINDGSKETI